MRVSKGLVIGIIGALLAGGAEVVAESALKASAGAHEGQDRGIEVPVARGAILLQRPTMLSFFALDKTLRLGSA